MCPRTFETVSAALLTGPIFNSWSLGGGASVDPDDVTVRRPSDDVPSTRGMASWIRATRTYKDTHKFLLRGGTYRPNATANPAR